MESQSHTYIAMDLKSFYASVECVDRGLDPLNTNLVVADASRTQKTICLAVSPSLKSYGIPGRARLFEVISKVREVNAMRKVRSPGGRFLGKSTFADELQRHPELEVGFVTATPRMARYLEYSTQIYNIYLKYIAPEDIHVYSIDEVFLDVTQYLKTYGMTARELASRIATEILEKKGLTATAGIGTNLYLCKIAMDIVAKHMEPDDNGVRIAELDEISYRELLWDHRPLTDFWRVGAGYRKKLEAAGMFTMGDVARCSIGGLGDYYNEDLLYRMFGINAELLIDHAWGYEPVTMDLIKSYRPETNCISSGQVLHCATDFMQAKIVVREMAEQLAMDLVEKKLVTDQIVLTVGYDIDNLKIPEIADHYHGEITVDRYGRSVPKHAHGTGNLDAMTASVSRITEITMGLYERIVDPMLLTRRITLVANHLKDADSVKEEPFYEQMDLFSGGFLQTGQKETSRETKQLEKERLEKEKHLQEAMLSVKSKYGKNAILKAADLQEGATTIDRNRQIGGHKA
ncbi:DNA methylase [Waltera sp.]|uniref:Y-family DNA polymerase n=1 Tax=Waltera sp. TaxID=2815806 RepID=UPI003AB9835B